MNNEAREKLKQQAARSEPETKVFFRKISKKSKNIDLENILYDLHEKAFASIDCLDCANCCQSISPIIYEKDIDRISRHLRLKPSKVIERYFQRDEEGDYIFTNTPCPFLMDDNCCSIYQIRPKSCRDYPHTNHKDFYKHYTVTIKNTYICPIVYHVVEGLKQKLYRWV